MPSSLIDRSASTTAQKLGWGMYLLQIINTTQQVWIGRDQQAMSYVYLKQYDRLYLHGPFWIDSTDPLFLTELTVPMSEGGITTGSAGGGIDGKPGVDGPGIE